MFNKRCRLAALAGLACVARLAADGTGGDLVPAWGSMYAAGNTVITSYSIHYTKLYEATGSSTRR